MPPSAKFYVGQIVHHNKFAYRGAIFDVDATYAGSDEWYETVARSRPPKESPWYHVLVHGAGHTTYVAERHLEPDTVGEPVENPLTAELFGDFHDGHYLPKGGLQ